MRRAFDEVVLTNEEVEERKEALATLLLEKSTAEKEKAERLEKFRVVKADYLRDWNTVDKARAARIVELSMAVQTGKEKRGRPSDSPKLEFPPKDDGGEAA